jgi:S1-C subfamily serine protease
MSSAALLHHPKRLLAVLGLAALPLVGISSPARADDGAAMSQQEVDAIGESGVVYVSIAWQGYIYYHTADGYVWTQKPVEAGASCTGFAVSSDGYLVTAGHCADPEEGRKLLIDKFLSDQVDQGLITSADAQSIQPDAEVNWKVEGLDDGSPIVSTIKAIVPDALSGQSSGHVLTAAVVENRPLRQGDVTLLKVQTSTALPILQIAPAEPSEGDSITAIGYPASVDEVTDPTLQPSLKTGHVSALQTLDGVPFIQTDAALSAGMSGGPVVDAAGRVIGLNSYQNSGETQQFNFAADLSSIRFVLARNGVHNQLGAADTAYRRGLDDFFAGHYHAAVKAFDETLQSEPSHALAQEFKTKAIADYPKEVASAEPASSDRSGTIPVWLIAGPAAGLLAAAGFVVWLVRRSGRSRDEVTADPVTAGNLVAGGNPVAAGNPVAPTRLVARPTAAGFCRTCGRALAPGTRFCPQDGTMVDAFAEDASATSPVL